MFSELQVRDSSDDHMSAGCGGPTLMFANLHEKHSAAYTYMGLILIRINIINEISTEQFGRKA